MDREHEQKKRRRTCVDWVRRNIARRRRCDPAAKSMLQLLGLLSSVLALLPERDAFALPGRGNYFRSDRRMPPPDYELGAEAWARERGLEPSWYAVNRPKPRPSWNRLVRDLNRRTTKHRARVMIEDRVPEKALEWLREMIKTGDWIALRIVGRDHTEEEIRDWAVVAAMRWEIERQTLTSSGSTEDPGAAAVGPALTPKF